MADVSPFALPHADDAGDAGDPDRAPLPGDDLVADARRQITREIIVRAPPEVLWPHLLHMVFATDRPRTLLCCERPRLVVLGALYDHDAGLYLPFDGPKPARYWKATWTFVASPLGAERTRLRVRSRVAHGGEALRWCSVWLPPFSDFVDPAQLRQLARAAEGRPASFRASLHDAAEIALRALGASRSHPRGR